MNMGKGKNAKEGLVQEVKVIQVQVRTDTHPNDLSARRPRRGKEEVER